MSRLGWILVRTDSERHPFEDEDHSGNDSQLYPSSFHLNSGMFTERARNEPEVVVSKETNQNWQGAKLDSSS